MTSNFPQIEAWPPGDHAVIVVGGAVAGSEAAARCAERGVGVIVLDQGVRPYGKIEDGLPKWHEKLRHQEYARIDKNLDHPSILFVPRTALGADVSFGALRAELEPSATVLANGAWHDRPLPVPGIDDHIGRGFVYQNALVHWFNHAGESSYDGPRYVIPDGTIVVGGGLASIDVVKIINLQLYQEALARQGVSVTLLQLEQRGISEVCAAHEVDPDELGVRGCTLYYRRRIEDMPVANAKSGAPNHIAQAKKARVKLVERVVRKYRVNIEPCTVARSCIVEQGMLKGLVFERSEIVEGKVRVQPESSFDVRAPLIVSSIGSIPRPIAEIPMTGELYQFANRETGELADHPGVYGLGNVLTGQGNIRDSRQSALDISQTILDEYLGLDARVREQTDHLVDEATQRPGLSAERVRSLKAWVTSRWNKIGYSGDYRRWIQASLEH